MQADQKKMPLVAAMLKYKKEQVYPFHTPGHKGGRGMEALLAGELGAGALQMDVSLMAELDDLHCPEGCLAAAQNLAAQLYGSDRCFFAVNGTTQAIHAMLLTAVRPGGKVLIPRNAHRSVAGGLLLGDLQPMYILPQFDAAFGINTQVTAGQIEAALQKDPSIKAVLLTSPNYYGQAADIKAIAQIVHSYGAVLLVDEAHGPHLGFSDLLPPSALACGTDACAQSTHKILGAMTQCSMLQVRGQRLDLERAADVMSLLTTTSPNYLLMASLDAARFQLATGGRQMAEQAAAAADRLRQVLQAFDGLKLLDTDCVGSNGIAGFDRTKVTVNAAAWGHTGMEVADRLRQAGIAVELADADNVLFLVTYSDGGAGYDAVLARIRQVFAELEAAKKTPRSLVVSPQLPVPQQVMSLRQAFDSPKTSLALRQAAGKICAEQVSFYPPGIPVLLPGELITEAVIAYCENMKNLSLPVSGPADGSLREIRVVL